MRSLLAFGLMAVLAVPVVAQRRGNNAPPLVGPSYPGVGGALPIVNPFSPTVPFPQRLGATISGFPSYGGVRGSRGFRGGRPPHRSGFVGYGGYPLLYPTFGPPGDAYDNSAYDQPPVPPPQQPDQPPSQNFSPPPQERASVQSYSAPTPARPEPQDDRPLFFIGLTDSSVYTAVAYWVEGGALNYVTPQGRHNQVSLPLIDRETTARLNKGSQFQLHLPGQ